MNTPLPVENSPTAEDKGSAMIGPSDHTPPAGLAPLLVSRPVSQAFPSLQLGLSSLGPTPLLPPQPTKPRLLLQRTQPVHREVTSCREALQPRRAEPVPAPGSSAGGHWLHPEPPHRRPSSRNGSSSGSQRLKNKTKNLWNPTYGSWVLENLRGKKALAHTQSAPLSSSTATASNAPTPPPSESNEAECSSAHAGPSSLCTPSTSSPSSHRTPTGSATKASLDLAKLQSFPCGNVNHAYDEQSHEAERLPLATPKAPDATAHTGSAPGGSSESGSALGLRGSSPCTPGLLLKRHASCGHEDVRRHAEAEEPARDRDSGFSLSEDLSVTPV